MVWLPVGNRLATREWEDLGAVQSDVLRVSFTFLGDIPSGVIYGLLRERFATDLYGARWYNLYPKPIIAEVMVLERIPELGGGRVLQLRKKLDGYEWSCQVDQWI